MLSQLKLSSFIHRLRSPLAASVVAVSVCGSGFAAHAVVTPSIIEDEASPREDLSPNLASEVSKEIIIAGTLDLEFRARYRIGDDDNSDDYYDNDYYDDYDDSYEEDEDYEEYYDEEDWDYSSRESDYEPTQFYDGLDTPEQGQEQNLVPQQPQGYTSNSSLPALPEGIPPGSIIIITPSQHSGSGQLQSSPAPEVPSKPFNQDYREIKFYPEGSLRSQKLVSQGAIAPTQNKFLPEETDAAVIQSYHQLREAEKRFLQEWRKANQRK